MALKIRLQRKGTRHAPVYRMVVAESTSARDGRFVELLGTYAPQARGQDKELSIKLDRIDYWLGLGALPTDTAKDLIRKARKLQAAEKPAEEPVEPVVEEPAEKPVVEPVAEKLAEQAVEPVAVEPVVEEPAEKPVEEPVAEKPAEQAVEPVAEEPVVEEPVKAAVEEPAKPATEVPSES